MWLTKVRGSFSFFLSHLVLPWCLGCLGDWDFGCLGVLGVGCFGCLGVLGVWILVLSSVVFVLSLCLCLC